LLHQGIWNDGDVKLIVKLTAPSAQKATGYLRSYTLPVFQFRVTNNVLAQEPSELKIHINSYPSHAAEAQATEMLRLENLDIDGTKLETPFFIQKVWTRADGGQSTGIPATQNTITVTLQTNFKVNAGDRVTIKGLRSAIARKGMLALKDPHGQSLKNISSILCSGIEGKEGEAYWCPGISSSCPCEGHAEKRMIFRIESDINPCPGTDSLQQCMAHRASQIVFSFDVYNPFVENGQDAPTIVIQLQSLQVPDTVLKTCREPAQTIFLIPDDVTSQVLWPQILVDGKCIADEHGCIKLASDRTQLDRCPSAPYPLNAPMRVLPVFRCFQQKLQLEPEDDGFKNCGSLPTGAMREAGITYDQRPSSFRPYPIAQICARNSSSAFLYANSTLRALLNTFKFQSWGFSEVAKWVDPVPTICSVAQPCTHSKSFCIFDKKSADDVETGTCTECWKCPDCDQCGLSASGAANCKERCGLQPRDIVSSHAAMPVSEAVCEANDWTSEQCVSGGQCCAFTSGTCSSIAPNTVCHENVLTFTGKDLFNSNPLTEYKCSSNFTRMCTRLGLSPKQDIASRLGIEGCCSNAWAQYASGESTLMVAGFPKFSESSYVDSGMCQTDADCVGIDPDFLQQLSLTALSDQVSVARLPGPPASPLFWLSLPQQGS
jgi:hypothetical protein